MSIFHTTAAGASVAHLHRDNECCPWCDQRIPPDKLEEITERIATRERQHQNELASRLREQFAREKAEAETATKALIEDARRQAAAALEDSQRASVAREAAARTDGEKVAREKLQAQFAEFEIAKKAAEARAAELAATQKALLDAQKEALELAKSEAVNAEKVKAYEEKLKLETKLQEMTRALQSKTAGELGETAEVDLFETLKQEFVEDRLSRIEKGAAGPDIIHDVVHGGRLCGRIVYDAKNRNAWRNDYVTKLRQDQIAFKADHAILSSSVFPSGAKQLHVEDGVIIASPARVRMLAALLRRHIIQAYTLRQSNEARAQKSDELYAFIISERCAQFLDSIAQHSESMVELDTKERKAHDATWKKREELIRSVQRVHGQLTSEIERIIGS